MAAKKKSAIELGNNRPKGIVDDILRPVIYGVSRALADRGTGKIASKLDKVADKTVIKRVRSYAKKGNYKDRFIDAEVSVRGPKTASKNYKAAAKAKSTYKKDMYKSRAQVVNRNTIEKLKKK